MEMTEQDMREFFQKVVDHVASLSTQASKVDGLETRVNELHNRVEDLTRERNEYLRQIADANNTVAAMAGEIDNLKGRLEAERASVEALKDTIFRRDARVTEVETNLTTERDAHRITISERDDARTKIGELESELDKTKAELVEARGDSRQWYERAKALEAEVVDLSQKLDRVKTILSPLQAVA